MVDPYVILAPVFLLLVVALLRFVGCALLLGVDDVQYASPALDSISPTSATVGDPPFTLTLNGSGFAVGGANASVVL
jgi:hypothetical protein